MSSVCENCLNKIKYHSSNTDSFSNKKFDIYFCNRCFIGKTNLDKDFDHYFVIDFLIKKISNYLI